MTGRTVAVGVLVALLSGGCGTMYNLRKPVLPPVHNPGAEVCRVYGGVRGDFAVMTEYPWRDPPTWLDYVLIPALAVLHLAFTTLGDTVTLPYPIGAEVRRALQPPAAPPEQLPVIAPGP